MAAGDRQLAPALRLDQLAGAQLVIGVAHREVAGHGETLHGLPVLADCPAHGLLVELGDFRPHAVVAATHEDDFIGGEAALVGDPVDETLVVADEQETGRMSVALDEGVRRQGRRQAHQLHAGGDRGAIATVAGLVEGCRQGPDDTGREVVRGGE